eukprot:7035985-Alexandrium_andersonii.AAC.1
MASLVGASLLLQAAVLHVARHPPATCQSGTQQLPCHTQVGCSLTRMGSLGSSQTSSLKKFASFIEGLGHSISTRIQAGLQWCWTTLRALPSHTWLRTFASRRRSRMQRAASTSARLLEQVSARMGGGRASGELA